MPSRRAGAALTNPDDSTIELPASPAAPALARRHLRSVCAAWPEAQLDTVLLITTELVTNAVLHGQSEHQRASSDGNQHLLLSTRRDADELRVEITDLNEIFPEMSPITEDGEGGRGLHIVTELATTWGTLPPRPGQGKTVWFRLHL